jgi:hypothetical protein
MAGRAPGEPFREWPNAAPGPRGRYPAGLLSGMPSGAQAHCDSADGPVAQAAQAALDSGNPNLVLPYAPAAAEDEIQTTFEQAMKVRSLGAEAKDLADRAFIETTVRLHRAGENAAYTGLKPAGTDFGPAIPAAERVIETSDLSEIKALLERELEHGLEARFERVLRTREAPSQPQTAADVPAARERVSAEFAFVAYVEGMYQAAQAALGHEHKE